MIFASAAVVAQTYTPTNGLTTIGPMQNNDLFVGTRGGVTFNMSYPPVFPLASTTSPGMVICGNGLACSTTGVISSTGVNQSGSISPGNVAVFLENDTIEDSGYPSSSLGLKASTTVYGIAKCDGVTTLCSNGIISATSSGGSTPTGNAGGDLGGTYPNPTVVSVGDVNTGTLGVANGGTGVSTLRANGVVLGNGTSGLAATTTLANGVLTSGSGGIPVFSQTIPLITQGNITNVGTLTSGTWQGTAIANAYLANSSATINTNGIGLSGGGSVALGATTTINGLKSSTTVFGMSECDGTTITCANGVYTAVGAAASTPLSSITSATTTNSINNTNNAQTWIWSTATTQNPLSLTATELTTGTLLTLTTTAGASAFSVSGNSSLTGTTSLSNAQIAAGNAVLTNLSASTVTGTTGNFPTLNFTNALGTTITATNHEGTSMALSGTATVGYLASTTTPISVSSGGTGANTLTQYGALIGNGTGAVTAVAQTTTPGYVLTSTTSAPKWAASSGGSGNLGSSTTATNPSNSSNAGTGLWSSSTSDVSIAVLGSDVMDVVPGSVGIGTTAPVANLEVDGTIQVDTAANGIYGATLTTAKTLFTFGDSITCGTAAGGAASCSTLGFANQVATAGGFSLTNYAISGEMACDTAYSEVFPNTNLSLSSQTISTLMVGTNEATIEGVGAYEAIFQGCHKAMLTWLTVPSQYKSEAAGANCTTTGTWTADSNWGSSVGLVSTTNGSTLTCTLTTYGGPLYLWYVNADSTGGTFTYAVDGGSTVPVTIATTPAIATQNGGTHGENLIRITGLSAASHSVVINVTSSTSGSNPVSVGGIGTPPPTVFWSTPTLFSMGVIEQENNTQAAATLQYNNDALADNTLIAGDGLPVRTVDVRPYLNNTTDMYNTYHPNLAGHTIIAQVIEKVAQFPIPTVSSAPAGQLDALQAYATSTTFYGASSGNGLYASTTGGGGLHFLSAVTSSNLISLGDNGNDTTSVIVGESAGLAQATTGLNSAAVGAFSLAAQTTGVDNTALGWEAGQKITTGSHNLILGSLVASGTLTTGSGNIIIGTSANDDTAASSTTSALDIGGLVVGVGVDSIGSSAFTDTTTGIGIRPAVEINGTTAGTNGFGITKYSADANGALAYFIKSRSATTGSQTALQNSDSIGQIVFAGTDGTNWENAAYIIGSVGGSVSTGVVPGNLKFYTANSSGVDTLALTLDDAQNATFAAVSNFSGNAVFSAKVSIQAGSSPSDLLDVAGGLGLTATTATVPVNGAYLPSANTLVLTTSGGQSFLVNSSGNDNAALGYLALANNSSGSNNAAGGYKALTALTTGTNNTAFGYEAGQNILTDQGTTAIGSGALATLNIGNSTTGGNTCVGYHCGNSATTGVNNTGHGYNSLAGVTTGSQNTAYGYSSGALITTGTGNIVAGYNAASTVLTVGSNNIIIDNAATTTTSSSVGQLDIGGLIVGTGVDSAGSSVMTNTTTSVGVTPAVVVNGTASGINGFGITKYSANSAGAVEYFIKSRNATTGSQTALQNGDGMGQIVFAGTDGTSWLTSAYIYGSVGGSVSSGVVPGQLSFVTANASGTDTTAMVIDDAQQVTISNISTGTGSYVCSTAGKLSVEATACPASDKALKNDIGFLSAPAASAALDKLPAVVYTYKDEKTYGAQPYVGLYAQDVEKMDKRCAAYDRSGKLQNYDERCLIAYLVAAHQEQQREIKSIPAIQNDACYSFNWIGRKLFCK